MCGEASYNIPALWETLGASGYAHRVCGQFVRNLMEN